jgi:hypothetical protein
MIPVLGWRGSAMYPALLSLKAFLANQLRFSAAAVARN